MKVVFKFKIDKILLLFLMDTILCNMMNDSERIGTSKKIKKVFMPNKI